MILDIIKDIIQRHKLKKDDNLWIFFDELNTTPDIGYFKEVICYRTLTEN